ncbi:MAG: hypothetical protein AAGF01_23795 [Cyanobacteria bacterium P01_G01_bin.38]
MTPEMAYAAEQANRELQDDQMEANRTGQVDPTEEAWRLDYLALETMIQRWGTRQILSALAEIHQQLNPDGSKVDWRILSRAYQLQTNSRHSSIPASYDDEF